jgi:hypothetical protein
VRLLALRRDDTSTYANEHVHLESSRVDQICLSFWQHFGNAAALPPVSRRAHRHFFPARLSASSEPKPRYHVLGVNLVMGA